MLTRTSSAKALPFAYGVFQKHYAAHEPFKDESGDLSAIGTTTTVSRGDRGTVINGLMPAQGVAYFMCTPAILLIQRWPSFRKHCAIIGLVLTTSALLGASFAQSVAYLIATQGVLFGLGLAALYSPFLFYLDDWFDKRKGFAYGCLWAGTGAGGLVTPLLMGWGLEKFGFRTMLRAWAILMTLVILPLIVVIKPRKTPRSSRSSAQALHIGFLSTLTFWIFQSTNIMEGLGYFLPSTYLPTFVDSIGIDGAGSSAVVSVLNCASIAGFIFLGYLVDHFHVSTVWLLASGSSSLAVFLLWALSTKSTQPLVYIFSIVWGVFAGGFAATWTGVAKELQRYLPNTETAVVLGVFGAGRGIGNVISGPVSEKLVQPPSFDADFGYGTKYGPLMIFTGLTAAVSGLGFLSRFPGRPLINYDR